MKLTYPKTLVYGYVSQEPMPGEPRKQGLPRGSKLEQVEISGKTTVNLIDGYGIWESTQRCVFDDSGRLTKTYPSHNCHHLMTTLDAQS